MLVPLVFHHLFRVFATNPKCAKSSSRKQIRAENLLMKSPMLAHVGLFRDRRFCTTTNEAKTSQHAADGSSPTPSVDGLVAVFARMPGFDADMKHALSIQRATPTDTSTPYISLISGVSSQLADDLVQAVRDAAESMPQSSVQSPQAWLEWILLAKTSPRSTTLVCASERVSDQLAIDLLKCGAVPMDH